MEQTLLLNATYEPLKVVHWQKAVTLWCQGKVEIISVYDREIRSVSFTFKLPSVIRLLEYRRIPHQTRSLSRKNIMLRDRYTCQYCGHTFPASELTMDHVIPRSRGGTSAWENLVTCCIPCNNLKGNRTPEEAGMKLQRMPRPFTLHTSRHLMRLLGRSDDQWRKYLFY